MRKIANLSVILIVLSLCACKGKVRKSLLPTATGLPYEVMVVMTPGAYEGPAGRALFNILNADVPGLPQSEPLMKVSSVAPANFSSFIKYIRNVIAVEISEQYTTPHLTYTKDAWADGQAVLYLRAPSEKTLEHFLASNGEKIINFFHNSELSRTAKFYTENPNSEAEKLITEMFGVSMSIPDFLKTYKEGENFFWITDNTASPMNILVYAIPYKEQDAFTIEKLIHVRDSVLKANIQGALEDSYMATAMSFPPTMTPITVNKKYCAQLRGLWEMKNDMMGGPFVSHTRLDEANNRLITVEAFIFAPSKEKRNMLKRMEAALYTLKLPNEHSLPEIVIEIEKETK